MPVICEKPIADTLEAAKAMVATAQKTGLPCAIIQNYRYARNKQELVRIREEETVGTAPTYCGTVCLRLSPLSIVGQGVAARYGFQSAL